MQIIVSPSKEMKFETSSADQAAIRLYNGLQYRYLRAGLTEADFTFLNESLRIISAEYGVVKPLDRIRPYRRDFSEKGLYKTWGDRIYQQVIQADRIILNVASDEFAKTITRYATDEDRIVTVAFLEQGEDGKLKKHAAISKKGRGQLVNYIARNKISALEAVKDFSDMGYRFNEELSDDSNWVFVRNS